MTLCSLFAALLAVCAWICIPLGDTVLTLQTFGVFLALLLLGPLALLLFLLLAGRAVIGFRDALLLAAVQDGEFVAAVEDSVAQARRESRDGGADMGQIVLGALFDGDGGHTVLGEHFGDLSGGGQAEPVVTVYQ